MSETHLRPTIVSDIEPLTEIVELKRLKTRDGRPVRVLCERIDELISSRIMKVNPGPVDPAMRADASPEEILRAFRSKGEALIEHGTAMLREDGSLQRPAFWSTSEVPGALPARLLGSTDFSLLSECLLRLGGMVGGAADEGSFPPGQPGGDGHGQRAVAGGAGAGDDPAAGAA